MQLLPQSFGSFGSFEQDERITLNGSERPARMGITLCTLLPMNSRLLILFIYIIKLLVKSFTYLRNFFLPIINVYDILVRRLKKVMRAEP